MKKFIVTGAAQGIGFQVVKDLLALNHFVIFNDIDSKELEVASKQLKEAGFVHFSTINSDSSSIDFLNQLENTINNSPGQLAGVVCNAGITTFGDFWTYERSSMDRILEVNIKGTFFFDSKNCAITS